MSNVITEEPIILPYEPLPISEIKQRIMANPGTALLSNTQREDLKHLFGIDVKAPKTREELKKFVRAQVDIWENMTGPKVSDYFAMDDVAFIRDIVYNHSSMDKKDKMYAYRQRFEPRGLEAGYEGFNRMLFNIPGGQWGVKIPFVPQAMNDAMAEYTNQHILRPLCTKILDCTGDGSITIAEMVEPIKAKEVLADRVKEMAQILQYLKKGFTFSDLGSNAFANWGIRRSMNPYMDGMLVLLDFPYIYKVNKGKSLRCTKCGGRIVMDGGFNEYRCAKCGTRHAASTLGTPLVLEDTIPSSYEYTSNERRSFNMSGLKVTVMGEEPIIINDGTVVPVTRTAQPVAKPSTNGNGAGIRVGKVVEDRNSPIKAVTLKVTTGGETYEVQTDVKDSVAKFIPPKTQSGNNGRNGGGNGNRYSSGDHGKTFKGHSGNGSSANHHGYNSKHTSGNNSVDPRLSNKSNKPPVQKRYQNIVTDPTMVI